ncbi:CLUMA_CG004159, isoform A [Clunio marinus]|uniref:CLUMA_CG004159, isoform A n=1 Tax=Clunio marinus TaxID=568069 RepID=A0A1J1HQR5_9DIPT|nr:CLUMA_CG004159, isoform A [Clunio marinus]
MAEISANQINPSICTHVIYSFIGLDSNGGLNYLWRSEGQSIGFINGMNNLKAQNPNLKTIVAVGGGNDGLVPVWSQMAANPNSRSNFASNILSFLRKHNLDGVDIDWEYPNMYENSPHDKNNFVLLLQALKNALGSSYSLSVAIGAGNWRTGLSYDVKSIFNACSFVNLMTYDMHGGWEGKTGHHSALHRSSLDPTDANVEDAVNVLLREGIDRSKLIVGIPTYGGSFNLVNANNNGIGAPATGAGIVKYNQICQRIRSGQFNYRWESTQKVPYVFSGNEWIGFDDVKSVTEKANFIKNTNLGGAMFWDLDNEDFGNSCGGGSYPLISTVYNVIRGNSGSSTNPPVTNPPMTNPPTTKNPGNSFFCPGDGIFANPNDCRTFYNCASGTAHLMSCGAVKLIDYTTNNMKLTHILFIGFVLLISSQVNAFVCPGDGIFANPNCCRTFYNCGHGRAHLMSCGPSLYLNQVTKACDWPRNVRC